MNYAIQTLKKERNILYKALNSGTWEGYTEAKKEREKRLNELDKAIKKLSDG